MNMIQIETIREINKLLGIALEGKIENLQEVKKAKKLAEELIEFKDFDTWKLVAE